MKTRNAFFGSMLSVSIKRMYKRGIYKTWEEDSPDMYPPKVKLVSRNATLDWDIIEKAIPDHTDATSTSHKSPDSPDTLSLVLSNFQVMIKAQRHVYLELLTGEKSSSLLDVLTKFCFPNATNPRDNVYALFVSDRLGIEIDYSKSVTDMYIDVACRIINFMENIDMICKSPWPAADNRALRIDIPSWCPDFFAHGETLFLFAQHNLYDCKAEPLARLSHSDIEADHAIFELFFSYVIAIKRGKKITIEFNEGLRERDN
ncbi:hypothetical protein BT63DRAFT_414310 [Microthyrium microscopicum]|uniref:Uncharacterized protein n=1 Tax=Microthyrium microscopicum TaxID=703497 RepID=A0A6A6UBJ6_9PEZI|nr:hypothetical protein BT63DRAFT_414310 [Microthyrium microscopicum]